jgi:hypothetical protein
MDIAVMERKKFLIIEDDVMEVTIEEDRYNQ